MVFNLDMGGNLDMGNLDMAQCLKDQGLVIGKVEIIKPIKK
jgi:hypothetical protein